MKYTLIALLIVLGPIAASAQKNVFFGDAGISLARFYPGASFTYNYNVVKWIGVGAGVQGYDFHVTEANFQYVPAAFVDLRVNIRPRKKDQFFAFLDIGVDFYKKNNYYWRDGNTVYTVRNDNGNYGGLGIGYFRRITKRGWGPYASLKIISNSYRADSYNIVSNEQGVGGHGDATFTVNLGFKF